MTKPMPTKNPLYEPLGSLAPFAMALAAAYALYTLRDIKLLAEDDNNKAAVAEVEAMAALLRRRFLAAGVKFDRNGRPRLPSITVDLEELWLSKLRGMVVKETHDALVEVDELMNPNCSYETELTASIQALTSQAVAEGTIKLTISDPDTKEMVPASVRAFFANAKTGKLLRPA